MKKKAIASLTIAGLMALQVPVTAFAACGTWYIDGDKTGNVIVNDSSIGATFDSGSNINATLDGYIQLDYTEEYPSNPHSPLAIDFDGTSNTLHVTGKDSSGNSVIVHSDSSDHSSGAINVEGSGAIVIDGNIQVIENGTPLAVGGIGCASSGTSVTAGDVNVTYGNTSGNAMALGIENNGSQVTAGDVTVTNNGVYGNPVNSATTYGINTSGGTTATGDLTVTGNSTAYGVYATENTTAASITVDGDITVESNAVTGKPGVVGITVKDNQADVTVKAGKITATNHDFDGSPKAIVADNSETAKVTIECTGVEINAEESGSLLISGAGSAGSENEIHINGAITGNIGNGMEVYTENGKNTITVDSDLRAAGMGILLGCDGGMTDIAVNGTLSGDEMALYVFSEDTDDYSISVYGLATSDTGTLANDEAVLANVNYIVHGNDGAADYKNMTFDPAKVETVTVNGKTYYTAKEGTITVTVNNGYALKSTQALSGSGNTYTVTIPQGGFVTLETILAAVEKEESGEDSSQKPVTTGSIGAPVMNGIWNMAPDGTWSYRTNALFRSTWAYIGNPYAKEGQAKEGWFYFDENGVMLTGWQKLDGKWYYFNKEKDGTQGQMFADTTTPDGYRVGADGVLAE